MAGSQSENIYQTGKGPFNSFPNNWPLARQLIMSLGNSSILRWFFKEKFLFP